MHDEKDIVTLTTLLELANDKSFVTLTTKNKRKRTGSGYIHHKGFISGNAGDQTFSISSKENATDAEFSSVFTVREVVIINFTTKTTLKR